jgi:hypothetical protein
MHKNATKCNETLNKWCKNKHRASKIMDTLETYHTGPFGETFPSAPHTALVEVAAPGHRRDLLVGQCGLPWSPRPHGHGAGDGAGGGPAAQVRNLCPIVVGCLEREGERERERERERGETVRESSDDGETCQEGVPAGKRRPPRVAPLLRGRQGLAGGGRSPQESSPSDSAPS